ncbi:MAG TPA: glycosyltransferase family 2 protein [Enteractinococcus sp.]
MIHLGTQNIDLVLIIALALILGSVCYGLMLFVLSRFERRTDPTTIDSPLAIDPKDRDVVFLIPCLNEAEVIGASLDRLTALDHDKIHILVIDDGSDDLTADIVEANPDPRVRLLRRVPPNARQGKGEALNAAVNHIRNGALGDDFNAAHAIIVVVDADGRLEPHVLDMVLPSFNDPEMGGVQIGVRINNRHVNMLARMQDIEFVLYTQVFQRGRRHLGSVGLGGNGQFVRFTALNSLGPAPWTKSLAEDLDLGIRLMLAGWRTEFCSETSVHQQGLVDIKRWVKQRTRWFQGHLQSWELMPWVLSKLSGTRRLDLGYHITSPYLLLVASLFTVAFGLWILDLGALLVTGGLTFSPWWLSSYAIAFGPVMLFGTIYWQEERHHGLSWLRAVGVFHLFALYATLWYLAGWRAAFRMLMRRTGWAKTERMKEPPKDTTDAGLLSGRAHPA